MKTINVRLYDPEYEQLLKIQKNLQSFIGKGVKVSISDAIRTCINEYEIQQNNR